MHRAPTVLLPPENFYFLIGTKKDTRPLKGTRVYSRGTTLVWPVQPHSSSY